jgi:hypothetical protein
VGSLVQQQSDNRHMPILGSQSQRCFSIFILVSNVSCIVEQKRFDNLQVTILGSHSQGYFSVLVLDIDVGSSVQQQENCI